ncbi:hypothetical protein [Halobacillus naozhouensis]|uniref:YqaI-like protein n=1 Tax=Halobacillus naozhouensis TaxID=554880 RepID=A0ABY8J138_9BACI|nr:hypothetical protein [Halobacillus naozhouensis]WFT76213.1 hypothetical protein P9989_07575 [Halobacillus naozhouensis]
MNHPVVEQLERTGYSFRVKDSILYGLDGLGNEVYEGDTILTFNEEFFLKETLPSDAIEILEVIGAEEKKA